jgi:hypothetical protein
LENNATAEKVPFSGYVATSFGVLQFSKNVPVGVGDGKSGYVPWISVPQDVKDAIIAEFKRNVELRGENEVLKHSLEDALRDVSSGTKQGLDGLGIAPQIALPNERKYLVNGFRKPMTRKEIIKHYQTAFGYSMEQAETLVAQRLGDK